ncbi:MAG: class I adenylate-forming enzyme family protein [Acidimicrobiales bacterium]
MATFLDPLSRALRVAADRTAVIDGALRYDYAELDRRCRRLAGALYGLGLSPGDRVAILAANGHRYLEAYLALPAAGLVIVPLNTRHAEPELEYALVDSGARVLLTDRPPGRLAAAVERVVELPDAYDALTAAAEAAELGRGVEPSSLAGLFYTGGTTGASKGVMLTHANLLANAVHGIIGCGLTEADVYLIQAPMFHAAGTVAVLGMVWLGGVQVTLPAFDPAAALDLVEAHGVTATLGVPTMVAALAEEQLARPRSVGTLRQLAHGGSPVASEVLRRAHQAFPAAELVHLYGATETAPIVTVGRREEAILDDPLIRSCGQPAVGVEVRICPPDRLVPLADGEVGEVCARGANIMAGYWAKPEQTAAVLQDGWYRTGDLGRLDAHGRLFLVDRAKDMIVSGGENVYSTEVEEVLFQHPAVKEATVFGVPDERWGEAVHAVIVPWGPPEEVDVEAILAFCRERIAGYKVPKSVELRREPLPVSGPGKVLKRELRAKHWAGREAAIN